MTEKEKSILLGKLADRSITNADYRRLEEESIYDDFLFDALLGYNQTKDNYTDDINSLKKKVLQKSQKRRNILLWMLPSAAAAAAILFYFLPGINSNLSTKQPNQDVADNTALKKEQDNIADFTKNAIDSIINDEKSAPQELVINTNKDRASTSTKVFSPTTNKAEPMIEKTADKASQSYADKEMEEPTIDHAILKSTQNPAVDEVKSSPTRSMNAPQSASGMLSESKAKKEDLSSQDTASKSQKEEELDEVVVLGSSSPSPPIIGTLSEDNKVIVPDSWKKFQDYVLKNSANSVENSERKEVILEFSIDSKKKIRNLKVFKSGGKKANKEAIRLLKEGHDLIPFPFGTAERIRYVFFN